MQSDGAITSSDYGTWKTETAKQIFVDILLVRMHFVTEMVRRTVPWVFDYPFPVRPISSFLLELV